MPQVLEPVQPEPGFSPCMDWPGSLSSPDVTSAERYTQREQSVISQSSRWTTRIGPPGRQLRVQLEWAGDEPLWLRPTLSLLDQLLRLPANWNSYGAPEVELSAAARALEILRWLMRPGTPAPQIVPTVVGGIQLEWSTRGVYLEIEVCLDGTLEVSFQDLRSGTEWERRLLPGNLAPLEHPMRLLATRQ